MEEFVSSILSSELDFNEVGKLFLIWIAALWVVFCVWVFVDAKKRYKSSAWAFFFFFAVLILNFPALVLYLIIRPENEENHVIYLANESTSSVTGGVNVPLINFTGEDGLVKLSLSLSMSKGVNEDVQFDIKVNDTDKFEITEAPVKESLDLAVNVDSDSVVEKEDKPKKKSRLSLEKFRQRTSSLGSSLRSKLTLPKRKVKVKEIEVEKVEESAPVVDDKPVAEEKPESVPEAETKAAEATEKSK